MCPPPLIPKRYSRQNTVTEIKNIYKVVSCPWSIHSSFPRLACRDVAGGNEWSSYQYCRLEDDISFCGSILKVWDALWRSRHWNVRGTETAAKPNWLRPPRETNICEGVTFQSILPTYFERFGCGETETESKDTLTPKITTLSRRCDQKLFRGTKTKVMYNPEVTGE